MHVKIDSHSIESVGEVITRYGLPQPKDKNTDEVFGPYSLSDDSVFLKYNAGTKTWLSSTEEPASVWRVLAAGTVSVREREACLDAMDAVRGSHPRYRPSNLAHVTEENTFSFKGWKFSWCYVPQLRRWELAAHGRA